MTPQMMAQEKPQEQDLFSWDEPEEEAPERSTSFQPDSDGKYRWVYELPMKHSFFLLWEVWRVFGIVFGAIGLFMVITAIISHDSLRGLILSLLVLCAVCGFLLVLSIPAYWLVTKANNGKYTVLFEMDGHGVDHIQIKTEKARALEILTMLGGQASRNHTVIGTGLLQAAGGSLYSSFADVKTIQAVPQQHLIRLNSSFRRNQIYADGEIFDEVYDFIRSHCINAQER
jgi:hypothetical protein